MSSDDAKARKEQAAKLATTYLDWMETHRTRLPKQAPAAVLGKRIMVRQKPPEAKSPGQILHIPDTAKSRPFEGLLVGAGDEACDILYDQGVERNDEVWFGKYVGVIEDWQHWLHDGDDPDCDHKDGGQSALDFLPIDVPDSQARVCSKCGAILVVEPMVVMNCDDLVGDVDLQLRVEDGLVRRYKANTLDEDGNPTGTRFVTERVSESKRTSWDVGPDDEDDDKIKAVG